MGAGETLLQVPKHCDLSFRRSISECNLRKVRALETKACSGKILQSWRVAEITDLNGVAPESSTRKTNFVQVYTNDRVIVVMLILDCP